MPAPISHTLNDGRPTPLAERAWFNALWFQVTWFCMVLGQAHLLPVGLALLLLHFVLVRTPMLELRQLALLGGLGAAVDASLSAFGLYQFAGDVLLPAWLVVLWLAFATTPRRSLTFLDRHTALPVLAGAIVMPLNYWAGQRLGAVEFPFPLATTLLVIGGVWAVLLPLLFRLARYLPGTNPDAAAR